MPTRWPPFRIYVALSVQCRKVWLTPTNRVPCSNAANTCKRDPMVRDRDETETFDSQSETRSRPSHIFTRPRRLETTSRDRDYIPAKEHWPQPLACLIFSSFTACKGCNCFSLFLFPLSLHHYCCTIRAPLRHKTGCFGGMTRDEMNVTRRTLQDENLKRQLVFLEYILDIFRLIYSVSKHWWKTVQRTQRSPVNCEQWQ